MRKHPRWKCFFGKHDIQLIPSSCEFIGTHTGGAITQNFMSPGYICLACGKVFLNKPYKEEKTREELAKQKYVQWLNRDRNNEGGYRPIINPYVIKSSPPQTRPKK